jgi:hypothetical protein
MDCLLSRIPISVRSLAETRPSWLSAEHAQCIGVALVSVAAVYIGYLYILGRREAAVAFNVPLPAELRKGAAGRQWEDAQGQEKRVLEDQVRGVSLDDMYMWKSPG